MPGPTQPQLLAEARPAGFVGEYVAPVPGSGDTKVPVLDVYEGEMPEAARAGLDESDARIYEFMPLTGDERDTTGEPFAVAAVGGIRRVRGGHVGAHLTLVVGNLESESASHTDTRNPVIEGSSRFGRLLEVLTREEGVDRLYTKPRDTNLAPNELRSLGFQAVGGESETLRLDLPIDARTAAAA